MKIATVVKLGALTAVVGYGVVAYNAPNLCLRGGTQRALPRAPVQVGDSLRLRAGGVDILRECDLAPPAVVRWRSSDSTIAHVDQTGLIHARRAGSADITVRAGWVTATHPVRVRD
jgi:hypothetical protein